MGMQRIALITERFPFSGADSAFLPREVEILAESFSLVVLPTSRFGAPKPLPSGVELDTSLCEMPLRPVVIQLLPALVSGELWREVRRHDCVTKDPRRLVRLAVRAARVRRARQQFTAWLAEARAIDAAYAWWSTPPAVGVGQALVDSGIPLVTRAHGYDLYASQDVLGFVPFQQDLLDLAASVYSASEAGAEYLRQAYPARADRVGVAYLGVDGPSYVTRASDDGVYRIVTCSRVVTVKRLDRLVEALELLVRSGRTVEWTHLGGGPLLEELQDEVRSRRIPCTFVGQIPHNEVITWLTSHPVDLFCNVSDSEGLPVSLMEASACGIPLLARNVGGNREIVDDSVGCLLPEYSEAGDIAAAIASLMDLPPESSTGMRRASRARWAERFQAEKNYVCFAETLADLAAERPRP